MSGTHQVNTEHDNTRDFGKLVFGVRVDALPQAEADRLAADGKFHPLTLDADGYLRVVLSTAVQKVTAVALNDQLAELLSLTRRMVLALEGIAGTPIPDPEG